MTRNRPILDFRRPVANADGVDDLTSRLAVVIDLYSRAVIGWSMKPTLAKELALDSLLMAIWRRRPKSSVVIHSDQGVQYGSDDWRRFCREHSLESA